MEGKCIILCAPSGAGKTSITRFLLSKKIGLVFSISACNRDKRDNEVNGVDYYFLNTEDFKTKIENNEFVEWEEVYNNQFYGTLISEIRRIWDNGNHVIFDVDVEGGLSLSNYFGERALSIFIQPPSILALENRLRNRGTENEEKIQLRLSKAAKELDYARKFDNIIVNDDLKKCQQEVFSIVTSFLNKE
jgi:guanylate kinase